MSLREGWIHVVHNTATSTKRVRTLLTPVGLLIFGGFTALFVVAAIVVDKGLGLPPILPEAARLPVSIPMTSLGIVITFWSAYYFLKVKGTPIPFNPPPELVTTGPYKLCRNPMLTGVFIFLFGLGFGNNSASLVVVFVPLFIAVNIWELKRIEEPELIKRLGQNYIVYREKTPMFIPCLMSWKRDEKE